MKKTFIFGVLILSLFNSSAYSYSANLRKYEAFKRPNPSVQPQPQKLDHNFNGKWHVLKDGRYMIHCSGGGRNWAASSGMALPNQAHGDLICGGIH
jgi:hypothetical protein